MRARIAVAAVLVLGVAAALFAYVRPVSDVCPATGRVLAEAELVAAGRDRAAGVVARRVALEGSDTGSVRADAVAVDAAAFARAYPDCCRLTWDVRRETLERARDTLPRSVRRRLRGYVVVDIPESESPFQGGRAIRFELPVDRCGRIATGF